VGSPSVEKLIAFWLSTGGALNPGSTEDQLAAFESRYRVSLPEDLRELLLTVNGQYCVNDPLDESRGLIEFHVLGEITPLYPPSLPLDPPAPCYFSFADFLISSHDYGILLSADSTGENPVAVFHDAHPIIVASSFSEFAEGYLANDQAVLFPPPLR
jgi:hypothetical protein